MYLMYIHTYHSISTFSPMKSPKLNTDAPSTASAGKAPGKAAVPAAWEKFAPKPLLRPGRLRRKGTPKRIYPQLMEMVRCKAWVAPQLSNWLDCSLHTGLSTPLMILFASICLNVLQLIVAFVSWLAPKAFRFVALRSLDPADASNGDTGAVAASSCSNQPVRLDNRT